MKNDLDLRQVNFRMFMASLVFKTGNVDENLKYLFFTKKIYNYIINKKIKFIS